MSSPRRKRPARPADAPVRAVGYLRVSTDEQVESGAGLAAQETAIRARAEAEGWELSWARDEGISAKDVDGRPGLLAALARLDAGDADVLVAAKLDRLSRSVLDFAQLMERAHRHGWLIVLTDLAVDMTSPSGELMATMLSAFAQHERRMIGIRTREGLASRRAAGVRLGRPSSLPVEVVERIAADRADGVPLATIAADLTEDGVPTARGGAVWAKSSVQAVLAGQDGQAAVTRLAAARS